MNPDDQPTSPRPLHGTPPFKCDQCDRVLKPTPKQPGPRQLLRCNKCERVLEVHDPPGR